MTAVVNIEMGNNSQYFRLRFVECGEAGSKIKQLKSTSGCLLILIFLRFLWHVCARRSAPAGSKSHTALYLTLVPMFATQDSLKCLGSNLFNTIDKWRSVICNLGGCIFSMTIHLTRKYVFSSWIQMYNWILKQLHNIIYYTV